MFGSVDGNAGNRFTSSRNRPMSDCHLASASARGRPADRSARVALASLDRSFGSLTIERADPRYWHLLRQGPQARNGGTAKGVGDTGCDEVIVRRIDT